MKRALVILTLSFTTPSFAQNRATVVSPVVSMDPLKWSILYSPGMPLHPTAFGPEWRFDVPPDSMCVVTDKYGSYLAPCSVHYVQTPYKVNILGKSAVSFSAQTIVTDGAPVFNYTLAPDNTCVYPAHARVLLERDHDNGGEFMRWWSYVDAYALDSFTPATVVSSLFDYAHWTSVFGKHADSSAAALKGFQDAQSHLGLIGITFGGGCFAGHGVNTIGGTVRFVLTAFQVQ